MHLLAARNEIPLARAKARACSVTHFWLLISRCLLPHCILPGWLASQARQLDLVLSIRMAPAVPIKYNFYHSDGGGRDGFIRHVSEHQTQFNYVPKAPECAPTAAISSPRYTRPHSSRANAATRTHALRPRCRTLTRDIGCDQ